MTQIQPAAAQLAIARSLEGSPLARAE